MNRDEAVTMLTLSELAKLSLAERALHVETAVGEGLLEDRPTLVGATDDPGNEVFDPVIVDALRLKYVGTKNEYLSEQIRAIGLGNVTVDGTPEMLAVCPCCRFRTLAERGEYDICPVCNWEDTGIDDATKYSGPNHGTLDEARREFAMKELAGGMADALVKYVRQA